MAARVTPAVEADVNRSDSKAAACMHVQHAGMHMYMQPLVNLRKNSFARPNSPSRNMYIDEQPDATTTHMASHMLGYAGSTATMPTTLTSSLNGHGQGTDGYGGSQGLGESASDLQHPPPEHTIHHATADEADEHTKKPTPSRFAVHHAAGSCIGCSENTLLPTFQNIDDTSASPEAVGRGGLTRCGCCAHISGYSLTLVAPATSTQESGAVGLFCVYTAPAVRHTFEPALGGTLLP